MKQIIPFTHEINFVTSICEVTSIALEHNINLENNDSIVGNFIVSGKYKTSELSINEEVFEEKIPLDIALGDKYDKSKIKIDIDNFYYEIQNNESLKIYIDVLLDNLFYLKEEQEEDVLINNIILPEEKTDESIIETRSDDDMKIKDEEAKVKTKENDEDNKTVRKDILNTNFISEKEIYVTYKVHILRDNEDINYVMEKYNITKEELLKYNDLDNVVLGTKIIIPTISNEQ